MRHHTPSNLRICRPIRITAHLGAAPCAHAQGQSRVQACRTLREACAAPAAWGMQTETPPKQAALARQVRQRMNRLGKPEHRARFCFFSKKKSRAGTRRFPITLEIQIPMGFNRSAASFATPKTFLQSPSFAGAKRQPHPLESPPHNAPPCSPRRPALALPHPLKPPHLPPASHHRAPRSHSYCAHAQGQSRVQACRTLREACAAPAA